EGDEDVVNKRTNVDTSLQELEKLQSVEILECEVTKDEIKRAVFDCGTNKSPRPDGFTFGFYHRYWKIIQSDVVDAQIYYMKMDDPDITMEEYIHLMADNAQRLGETINWETATYAIVYNDASTSIQNVSSEPTVSIYNAIKSDIDFSISYSDSEDEDYTFTYDKDSLSYKLIHVNDIKPEPVNDHVKINTELYSENIDIKPKDSIVCISNDTTPIEFDENNETNHDTPGTYWNENRNFWWSIYNLEVVKFVRVLKKFEATVQHIFARKRNKEDHTEQISGEFPVLILFNFCTLMPIYNEVVV
ncbi:hypothetical protein Tco_0825611, partial [Tanacetum coccineum]